ncbi:alpha/beta hydrolase [Yoonia sp. BS5-3]|uniref:Alpha/beta fold hydrolase n=1 Tax=Yoonia phaeophyticola TaxID=3137369 RepID=A0ABZ2V3F0_9RHOB
MGLYNNIANLAVVGLIGGALAVFGAKYRGMQAEKTYPPIGSFVETSVGQVHYVQEGSGPHVILLHGAGGNLREFTFDLMERLRENYTVTAFDRPGLGYTDRIAGMADGLIGSAGESPQAQAAMLREAAATLEINDPIVVGHSYGGAVGYAWAVAGLDDAENPVNAAGLVSLAGVTMPWPGDLGWYYRVNGHPIGGAVVIPLIGALVPNSKVQESITGTFAPDPVPTGYSDYIGGRLALRPVAMRANIRQVNTLRPHVVTMSARYPELTLPIEILHGTADMTVPIAVHAEEVIKIAPTAVLTPLEGVGHMPHHANPEATVAAIDRAAERAAAQPNDS